MKPEQPLTVGELIDELQKHPRDQKLRMFQEPSELAGVSQVVVIHGRVCIYPTRGHPMSARRRRVRG